MRAFIHVIFFIALIVIITSAIAYNIISSESKNMQLLIKDLKNKEKMLVVPFKIEDAKYEESGSVATLSFTLINLGYNLEDFTLPLDTWILEFTTIDRKTLCREILFTGNPLEATRVYTEVKLVRLNKTYDTSNVGEVIPPREVAEVTMTILQNSKCLNETIKMARQGEKMMIKLTIGRSSAFAILKCTVDPTTGFASCEQV